MSYIGTPPSNAFTSLLKQDFSTSATTGYTLDHAVNNANDIALFINFVRQEPTAGYAASGTSLVLTSATASSDDMYCVYLGQALQTVNPPNVSVGTAQLIDGAVTSAKLADGNNTPAFYGELASTQTIARNTQVKVTGMTNDEIDSDTAFDGTTFTVPSGEGGKYYIFGSVLWDFEVAGDDGWQAEINIYRNGSEIKVSKFRNGASGERYLRYVSLSASAMFTLSAGDTIELYCQSLDSSGNDARVLANATSLGAYKLIGV